MASEFGSILACHCFEFLSQIARVKRSIALIPKGRRLVEQPSMKVVVDAHCRFSDSFCPAANYHLSPFGD
jgi:hypothetical protein